VVDYESVDGAWCSNQELCAPVLPRVYVTRRRRRHHNGARCSGAGILEDGTRCSSPNNKTMELGAPVQRRGGVSATELQEDRQWPGDRANQWYYKKRWSRCSGRKNRKKKRHTGTRRRPVVLIYYRSGFMNPTVHRGANRSHNVRWWESG
jgi:hypothetical protein